MPRQFPSPHRWGAGDKITARRLDSMSAAIVGSQGKAPKQDGGTPAPAVLDDVDVSPGASVSGELVARQYSVQEIPIYSLNEDGTPNTDDQIGVVTAQVDESQTWQIPGEIFGRLGPVNITVDLNRGATFGDEVASS